MTKDDPRPSAFGLRLPWTPWWGIYAKASRLPSRDGAQEDQLLLLKLPFKSGGFEPDCCARSPVQGWPRLDRGVMRHLTPEAGADPRRERMRRPRGLQLQGGHGVEPARPSSR